MTLNKDGTPRKPRGNNHCTNCGVPVKRQDTMCRDCDHAYLEQCQAMQYGYNGPIKEKDFKVFKLPVHWNL